jgi:hypothetical protein
MPMPANISNARRPVLSIKRQAIAVTTTCTMPRITDERLALSWPASSKIWFDRVSAKAKPGPERWEHKGNNEPSWRKK